MQVTLHGVDPRSNNDCVQLQSFSRICAVSFDVEQNEFTLYFRGICPDSCIKISADEFSYINFFAEDFDAGR